MIRLTLPVPPSGNRYWRHVVMGKPGKQRVTVLLSKEARDYREVVAKHIMAARCPKVCGRLRVRALYRFGDRKHRDLDNFWKQLGDALAHAGVYGDDCQIDDVRLIRGDVGAGVVEIEIVSLEEQATLLEVA